MCVYLGLYAPSLKNITTVHKKPNQETFILDNGTMIKSCDCLICQFWLLGDHRVWGWQRSQPGGIQVKIFLLLIETYSRINYTSTTLYKLLTKNDFYRLKYDFTAFPSRQQLRNEKRFVY